MPIASVNSAQAAIKIIAKFLIAWSLIVARDGSSPTKVTVQADVETKGLCVA